MGRRKVKRKFVAPLVILVLLLNILTVIVPTTPKVSGNPDLEETIEVSQPIQLTTDLHYDSDSCFLIDQHGTYWLFWAPWKSATENCYYKILPNNRADLNWDYKVDIRDVAIVASNFGWIMEEAS